MTSTDTGIITGNDTVGGDGCDATDASPVPGPGTSPGTGVDCEGSGGGACTCACQGWGGGEDTVEVPPLVVAAEEVVPVMVVVVAEGTRTLGFVVGWWRGRGPGLCACVVDV